MNLMKKPGVRLKACARCTKDWARKNWKIHLVDTTAVLTSMSPIWTVFDTSIGMEDETSIIAKAGVVLVSYAGSGWLYGKLRDVSKKHFEITDRSKEIIQGMHDFLYNAVYSSIFTGLIYTVSREPDPWKIAAAVGFAASTAVVRGPISGYSIDAARDLTGLKECNRRLYPRWVKNRTPKIKKAIAASLIAASIGAQVLTYHLSPDKIEWWKDSPSIKQTYQQPISSERDQFNLLEQTVEGGL